MGRAFWPVLLLLFSRAPAFPSDLPPAAPQGVVELQGRTAVFLGLGSLDLMAELQGRLEDTDRHFGYRAATLGGYYRLLANLKVGAFYRLQAGARHDDDWVLTQAPTWFWSWQDTTGRLESLVMLDVSPRFQLDFLPGRNWVLMVKGRYMLNLSDFEQSILLRPQLTWFWLVDREPFLNVSLSYDVYFPLNFGQAPIYQQYPYLTVQYSVTPALMLELGGAYRTALWSAGKPWRDMALPVSSYPVAFSAWVIEAGVLYRLTP
jgi:hypothetical protein